MGSTDARSAGASVFPVSRLVQSQFTNRREVGGVWNRCLSSAPPTLCRMARG